MITHIDSSTEKCNVPYRYEKREMEELHQKGMEMYKSMSGTEKISLNQLLKICVKQAVNILPEKIKSLNKENNELKAKIKNLENEIDYKKKENYIELEKEKMKFNELKNEVSHYFNTQENLKKLIK